MAYTFEQGPIRPPSEARSLLIRATRNCPWNKCEFCNTYKGTKFERRSVEKIKEDIRKAKEVYDEIKALCWRSGQPGIVNESILNAIFRNPDIYGESHRSIAGWMYFGAENAFIQDANSLVLKTDDLAEVLMFLKKTFPSIKRITSYARSKTIGRKTIEELKILLDAGLSRLHLGLETGYDPLLEYVKKGITSSEHIEAGKKVKASGISLSEYIILGLGGRKWWREHALETARVLNHIDPDYIRLRTLTVRDGMPLNERLERGDFQLQSEEEIVKEERLLIENLNGISSYLISDHILNLLEEVEGQLPQDKQKMLDVVDRYLNLAERERLIFNFGRRGHVYRSVDDLTDMPLRHRVETALDRFLNEHNNNLEETFNYLRKEFI